MPTPIVPFQEQEISRLYAERVVGGENFNTSIIGNRYNIHQRNVSSINPPRKWTLDFRDRNATEMEALRTFFNSKYGAGIGFRFRPPSDYQFNADLIGTGTGGVVNLSMVRRYTGGSETMIRRIVKPMNTAVQIFYNGVLQSGMTLGSHYSINSTTGILQIASSVPGAGVAVTITGGEFCVPVVFGSDIFEGEDIHTLSNWSGVELIELLPANIGLT